MARFRISIWVVLFIITLTDFIYADLIEEEEMQAKKYLQSIEEKISLLCYNEMEALFNHSADMNPETSAIKAVANKENTDFKQQIQKEMMERFPNWRKYKNEDIRYQVKILLVNGPANMSSELLDKRERLQTEITQLQTSVKICNKDNTTDCNLRLADVSQKLKTPQDEEEAEYYWTTWQDAVGSAVTPSMYQELVNLSNIHSQGNGFETLIHAWLANFDDHSPDWTVEKFEDELHELMNQLEPYYQKLHAYVRMKLIKASEGKLKLPEEGYLPIHIIGCFFGLDWTSLAIDTEPFPNVVSNNVDGALVKANYTPMGIVKEAEHFFKGLNPNWTLPDAFWERSVFERPEDESIDISCHPSAYDFCAKKDFRIHMCIKITEGNLKVAYHEVGHVIYFLAYHHLPFAFREGANPGFHEAVGDTIALSVTHKHLKCELGLSIDAENKIKCEKRAKLDDDHEITEEDINHLYYNALSKIPSLAFGFSVDLWRIKVFNGSLRPEEYNSEWWSIRKKFQGVIPPSPRDSKFLDAMALFHVPTQMPYIIYFTSYILQYQFYEAMCIAADEYDPNDPKSAPLHRCDFSNSKKAGELMKEMLEQGASKDWKSVLEKFTGSREMSIGPLIHYYQPLFDQLDKELKENNFKACFGPSC